MSALTHSRIIKLKGILFLLTGALSSSLLLIYAPSLTVAVLLLTTIWSFCRFYYFAIYVIQHYADPSFRLAGLWDFARYMITRRSKN